MSASNILATPKTRAEEAYTLLSEAIIQGELKQGQKLNETELAERFGFGRGPLREAIRLLEAKRLATRVPHAGAHVITLKKRTLQDLYQYRECLEGFACRLAAERMSNVAIDHLYELLDQHEAIIANDDHPEDPQLDENLDFHYRIAQGSENRLIIDTLINEQSLQLRMCRSMTQRMVHRPDLAIIQHKQIVDAISARDGELAEILMRRHIAGAWNDMKEEFNKA